MTLRSKVVVILISVFIVYGVADFAIQRFVIFPGFQSLENEQALKNSKRVVQAIEREIHHLDLLCFDWAAWDDTYNFVESPSQEYIDANLVITVFEGNRLNQVSMYNTKGKVIWGQTYDLITEENIQLSNFPEDALLQNDPLLDFKIETTPLSEISVNGILMTDKGPMLVASRPVLQSNYDGPVRGAVVMGRFLDQDSVATLINQTEVDFKIYPVQTDNFGEAKKQILNRITDKSKFVIETGDKKYLFVYMTISDIKGNPAILVESKIPRDVTQKGSLIIRNAMYSIALAAVIVVIAVLLLLQWAVLSPVTKLTDHTLAVAKTGNLEKRLLMKRVDEIGILSGEFDMMLEQLSEARNKLIEQSYYSGLAEMAGELMHNARNILTPIVGQISFIQEKSADLPIDNMIQAVSEFEAETMDDKRKESMVRYLVLVSKQMLDFTEYTNTSIKNISENIMQIENILAEHDNISHSEKVIEHVQLHDILKNALSNVGDEYKHKAETKISKNISQLPSFQAERVVLTQVLTNLLNNAFESILKTKRDNGLIEVSGTFGETEKGVNAVHIIIKDNGQGVAEEDYEHIFERNFSKKGSLTGRGLHWCANIISSMNGEIYAKNNDPKQGVSFNLIIPIKS